MTIEFDAWPKTPRLFKDITITEKIDGTNAAVIILPNGEVGAQSRNRLITPEKDNHGFAAWVARNHDALQDLLGPGRHFGEWWGAGIQRGYWQQGKKWFSLFNTAKWGEWRGANDWEKIGLRVVPEMYVGPFSTSIVQDTLTALADVGSVAAPGFPDPEGVCIFHHASRTIYKATLPDDVPKYAAADNVIPLGSMGVVTSNPETMVLLSPNPRSVPVAA